MPSEQPWREEVPRADPGEIYDLITELAVDVAVFVREKGFSRFPHETQALFKVVGVADLAAWKAYGTEFVEIAPTTVKKLLTGSGKANKDEVAAALEKYIGEQQFEADDESDAVAVGIAWLILCEFSIFSVNSHFLKQLYTTRHSVNPFPQTSLK